MHPSMFNGAFEGLVVFLIGVGIVIGGLLVGLFFLLRWLWFHLQWIP